MQTHELKTWPEPFEAVWDDRKPYEVRVNDRGFEVGDMLILQEFDPDTRTYLGRRIVAVVTYMTPAGVWGLPADALCVLGIRIKERWHGDAEAAS